MGAGLVTLGIPGSLNTVMEEKLTEVMTEPLPEEEPGFLGFDSYEHIERLMQGKRTLAIGPGITTREDTVRVVHKIVENSTLPVVIDADGINALHAHLGILSSAKADVILTPHPGEMARLVGMHTQEIQRNRVEVARSFAQEYGCHLVLKGARTIVAAPDGNVAINLTGNPAMASGGMGDVLTGMIPGLIAQGYDSTTSVHIAVYLHGLLGDILAYEKGPAGLLAGDLVEALPRALKMLTEGTLPPCLIDDARYQLTKIL
jgi:NAD(P)H-hydrate epimerase